MTTHIWYSTVRLSDTGDIDSNARHAFSNGQCHALALALSEKTGYPLYAFYDGENEAYGVPSHICIRTPRGYLDINGFDAEKKWRGESFPITVRRISRKRIDELVEERHYLTPDLDAGNLFADTLIRQYRLTRKPH